MEWIDTKDKLPEEGVEVLCAITKYGMRTIDTSYTKVTTDKDGVEWRRVGEQVKYELLWYDDGKWDGWETDDYENNANLEFVIAWREIPEYTLQDDMGMKTI